MNDGTPLILIVDDSIINLQLLGNILTGNGYKTVMAENGVDALSFIEKQIPDLILLDIMMPEMDGFEVCNRLKNNSLTKRIPVIFLTAKTGTEDIIEAFNVGGADYVTKPFNHEELLARVNTHIKLMHAFDEIKVLKGFIPICSNCKNIRDDQGYWEQIEEYLLKHTDAVMTHGICPECVIKLYPEMSEEILNDE